MEELFDTYNKILPDVLSRIIEFKSVWNEADEKSLFQELHNTNKRCNTYILRLHLHIINLNNSVTNNLWSHESNH